MAARAPGLAESLLESGGAIELVEGLVVATKLHIPTPRRGRLARPALVAALREADRVRLILVSAPAGAGKTTLLASWHGDRREERAFAWLSADARDNDPVRFWAHVLMAIRTVVPGFAPSVDARLRSSGADLTELAIPMLVNTLVGLSTPIVLVLDDYHEIDNDDIHQSVGFLIDHLPKTVQLAVATRSDPPLGLARLRARAELLEVDARALRLDPDEAGALLNGSLGLHLDPEQVRRLHASTEGWAAGLQLVGLSLQGHSDREGYISSFAGDDRQIVDYLALEVLARQTPATRTFLLRTSIADRLCGSLCDALLGTQDSQGVLEDLDRANLFLVPLDDRRVWYRYHTLFRDLLQRELRREEPGSLVALHERAYEWHVAEGLIPEAIDHATAAGAFARAAELIAAHWMTYVMQGQIETVARWTASLPQPVVSSDPRLGLAQGWMLVLFGRPGEAERALKKAEHGLPPGPTQDQWRSMAPLAAVVRAAARLQLGDVGASVETAGGLAQLEPDPAMPWEPFVSSAFGAAAYWSGAIDAAVDGLRQAVSGGEAVDAPAATIYALGYLAMIAAEREDYADAERLAQRALARAGRHQLSEHWITIMPRYALGQRARARGEIDEAHAAIESALNIARRYGLRLDITYGLLMLAQIATAAGDRGTAQDLVARAERQLAACPDPGALRGRVETFARMAPLGPRPTGGVSTDELSPRELTLLKLLPSRLSLREIGDEMYVSFNTVKTHTRRVYAKLRVSSRAEAVARAQELHLL